MSGKFIVIEGLDGSGKSYQAEKLTEYLMNNNIPVFRTQEPTNSEIGQLIRQRQKENPDNTVLFYLYTADRKEHCDIIRNLLNHDINVICDRYWYSSYAYQGVDNGNLRCDISDLYHNEDWVIKPDKIFFIDTDVNTCLERISKRGNNVDSFEHKDYLEKVRENYLNIWDSFEKNWPVIIDGNQSKEKVFEDIKKDIYKMFNV